MFKKSAYDQTLAALKFGIRHIDSAQIVSGSLQLMNVILLNYNISTAMKIAWVMLFVIQIYLERTFMSLQNTAVVNPSKRSLKIV